MADIKNKYYRLLQDFDALVRRIKKSTSVNPNETAKQKRERIARLEKDYIAWFEYYFPNFAKYKCAWFHKELAKKIIGNKKIRALAEWYRSAAKSVHIDMGIPLFLYLAKKDLNFMLLVGETEPKAYTLLAGVQAQLQYNERLKNDYGEKFQGGSWAEGDFTTRDGVRFIAIGFGSSPRGAREDDSRPDYIAVDDVDNRRHVNNDRLMEEGLEAITEDIWGCFDSADSATERFVYANNNFHKNGITNRLKQYFLAAIRRAEEEGERTDFYISTVNAVKDLKSFTPNWPEKTSHDYWRKKYNNTPYRSFMREYMNTHVADGSVFKRENILYGKMLPLSEYDSLVFYGDLSYKDAGDFKALILVGKKGREFHVIYTYLSRGSRTKCASWLYDLYEKKRLDRYNIKYLIEGLFAMDEFVNDFDLEGDTRGYYIPVVPDKRGKANKYDRIESISGHFERNRVIFNEDELNNIHQITLTDQLLAFAKGSKTNDDGPDALHGVFTELNKITRVDRFPAKTVSRKEIKSRSRNRF